MILRNIIFVDIQEISNGRTHVSRTPNKPEYLIARSQLTEGSSVGIRSQIQFLMESKRGDDVDILSTWNCWNCMVFIAWMKTWLLVKMTFRLLNDRIRCLAKWVSHNLIKGQHPWLRRCLCFLDVFACILRGGSCSFNQDPGKQTNWANFSPQFFSHNSLVPMTRLSFERLNPPCLNGRDASHHDPPEVKVVNFCQAI